LARAARKNCIIDSPQTYTTNLVCTYSNTKFSKTALKDIPCFGDEDFLNIYPNHWRCRHQKNDKWWYSRQ